MTGFLAPAAAAVMVAAVIWAGGAPGASLSDGVGVAVVVAVWERAAVKHEVGYGAYLAVDRQLSLLPPFRSGQDGDLSLSWCVFLNKTSNELDITMIGVCIYEVFLFWLPRTTTTDKNERVTLTRTGWEQ